MKKYWRTFEKNPVLENSLYSAMKYKPWTDKGGDRAYQYYPPGAEHDDEVVPFQGFITSGSHSGRGETPNNV